MMKSVITAIVFLLGIQIGVAQDAGKPETRKPKQLGGFEWLKQFQGEWSTAFNGTMNSRVIGEKWIVSEISFQKGVHSIQTIGYDDKEKQFIGTWVDVTSSYIWKYTGSLDATGKTLVLEATGPDLNDPTKMRKYRDTYRFQSRNEIAAVSQMLDDQKQWKTFGESKMTRKSK